ncbi:MAG: glutathionylspermidine synthase family protein, partial [Cellulomonadaceae bacterium]|nr:glutathionylspermidine synthase family protein [Cellulomonadaceae bacterium]
MFRSAALQRGITIGHIPPDKFHEYRLQQIFEGYKWDYQSGQQATISDAVVLLDDKQYTYLVETAQQLFTETVAMEMELKSQPDLLRELGLSQKLVELLSNSNYDPTQHIRMMRFDFHPTTTGWKISEVNSDVPAGFQESSLHPIFAAAHFEGYEPAGHFGASFALALRTLVPAGNRIAFVYDSHTVEDSQLLRFLGDYLAGLG